MIINVKFIYRFKVISIEDFIQIICSYLVYWYQSLCVFDIIYQFEYFTYKINQTQKVESKVLYNIVNS